MAAFMRDAFRPPAIRNRGRYVVPGDGDEKVGRKAKDDPERKLPESYRVMWCSGIGKLAVCGCCGYPHGPVRSAISPSLIGHEK